MQDQRLEAGQVKTTVALGGGLLDGDGAPEDAAVGAQDGQLERDSQQPGLAGGEVTAEAGDVGLAQLGRDERDDPAPDQVDLVPAGEALNASSSASPGGRSAARSDGAARRSRHVDLGSGAAELLRRADVAMYAAKRAGKGSWVLWTPDLPDPGRVPPAQDRTSMPGSLGARPADDIQGAVQTDPEGARASRGHARSDEQPDGLPGS